MKGADYERIKKKIGEVFEENSDFLNTIPIDVFGLARKMGFKLIKASDLLKKRFEKAKEFSEINKNKDIYGFSFFDNENMEFVIYYDDVNTGHNKRRFSVAHEIGHIVLGHVCNNMVDAETAENEANYFAGYLLCPDCLSTNEEIFQILTEQVEMMPTWFGIAVDTAMIKYEHHKSRKDYKDKKEKIFQYEKIILNCLEEAVLTKIRD